MPTSPPSEFKRSFVLLVATFSFFVYGLSLFSYPAISPTFSSLFSLSNTQSGLVTSAFGIGYAILQIPGGLLVDRFGGAKILLLSLSIATISPIILIVGKTFAFALISRIMAGAAFGIMVPSDVRLISSWFPKNELNRAMSIFGSGWGACQIVSFVLLPLLLFGSQWEVPLLFVVFFALTATFLAVFPLRWKSDIDQIQEKVEKASETTIETKFSSATIAEHAGLRGLFTRQLFALTLPNFAALALGVGVLSWASTFLLTLGFVPKEIDAGRWVALIGVAAIIATYLGGYGATKFGERRIIGISATIAVISPVLFGFFSVSLLFAGLWLFVIGLAEMLYLPADFALVPYAARQGIRVAGLEFGVFNTFSNIGGFISPVLVGYVLDMGAGFPLAFAVLGGLAILGVVGAAFIRNNSTIS